MITQNLDQVQAYILLHRWHTHQDTSSSSSSSIHGGRLSADQLRAVCAMYAHERLCLLRSIEDLLLLGETLEGSDGGGGGGVAFSETVEEVLGSLLGATPGLEEVAFQALKDNLEGNDYDGILKLKSGGGDGASNTSNNTFGAVAGGTSGAMMMAGMTAHRRGRSPEAEDVAALERNVLLSILGLIYFHPRKQCTQERFLELAHLFHSRLFAMPPPPLPLPSSESGGGGFILPPAHLSIKMVRHAISSK